MSMTQVSIPTPDGAARAFSFTPEGAGPWPAVIFYMDAPAVRPALYGMCERLAAHGYFVLLPDMFWRVGPYEPMVPSEIFSSEEKRAELFGKYMGSTDPVRSTRDTGAFLEWLSAQPEVKGDKVGATGYCMGGPFVFRTAAASSSRIGAGATFHGGGLVTDKSDSPHLLIPLMKAHFLIAIADSDDQKQPDAKLVIASNGHATSQ